VDVPIHAHEHFLHEVFGAFPVARRAIHEIQQAILVPVDQFVERTLLTLEERAHYAAIIELA
jgi:hypothetical protein